MPPFQANARVPVPAPTLPSSTAPSRAAAIAAIDVLGPDVQPANVVEPAVVGFADQRVDRSHLGVAGLRQRPAHETFDDGADARACW